MIIDRLNCLFVHVPKTAGQSIERFFLGQLGRDPSVAHPDLLLGRNPDPCASTEKLDHLAASEYVAGGHVSQERFSRCFKFAFVRNPYQRIVSEYRYRNYFGHRSFRHFILEHLPEPGPSDQYRHIMPQYDMLFDAKGNCLVDFVGRFENLQADFTRVCNRLDIGESTLPFYNDSDKGSRKLRRSVRNWLFFNGENTKNHYRELFDPDTWKAVTELYRQDLEVFGYKREGP
jgi:hypothetical protein